MDWGWPRSAATCAPEERHLEAADWGKDLVSKSRTAVSSRLANSGAKDTRLLDLQMGELPPSLPDFPWGPSQRPNPGGAMEVAKESSHFDKEELSSELGESSWPRLSTAS